MNINEIVIKWFKKLELPDELEELTYKSLEKINLKNVPEYSQYQHSEESNEKRCIYHLIFCEELSNRYREKGIPEEILMDTLLDLKNSILSYYDKYKTIGIDKDGEEWLKNHFSFNLFRLGRLQFCMYGMYEDVPEKNIKKGDSVMDVHIPKGESIKPEIVDASFRESKEFFSKYFPEYSFRYYTCFSWTLDDTLADFLEENSNIRKFRHRFEVVHKREQDSALHFIFKMGIKNREELNSCEAKTEFAKKLKEYALSGGKLYNVLGIMVN
ncbi:MAG: DUF5596 domain-containing protein [Clostridia bacterium]|nr:DUF5596 domain-containing protein [Clostridia bacterium]